MDSKFYSVREEIADRRRGSRNTRHGFWSKGWPFSARDQGYWVDFALRRVKNSTMVWCFSEGRRAYRAGRLIEPVWACTDGDA